MNKDIIIKMMPISLYTICSGLCIYYTCTSKDSYIHHYIMWFSLMYDNPVLSSMLFTLHIQCVLYRSFENIVIAILYNNKDMLSDCYLVV